MTSRADQIVRLMRGTRYDVEALNHRLVHVSWTVGDGTSGEGYHWRWYFADGEYLGPDQHGIEPLLHLAGDEPVAILLAAEGGAA